jgi:hypothetical protein
MVDLVMRLCICVLAVVGAVLQPIRWSDRSAYRWAKRIMMDLFSLSDVFLIILSAWYSDAIVTYRNSPEDLR